jgi:hypothetical protein
MLVLNELEIYNGFQSNLQTNKTLSHNFTSRKFHRWNLQS